MAHATLRLAADAGPLRFPNGTTLAGLGGDGSVRQRVTSRQRLRPAALPAEIHIDPRFDRSPEPLLPSPSGQLGGVARSGWR